MMRLRPFRFPWFGLRPPLLDRYLLSAMVPPMAASFGVILIALMLDRTLELVNLLAASSAQFDLIVDLMGNLVPHYLGLAVPAAYFISVFMVISRLSDTSELDAILASGVSMDRIALPLVGVGALISVASILLLGYIQPYGRYDYNANLNAALSSRWDARMQPKVFLTPDEQWVIGADSVDIAGRKLQGVFVRWAHADGRERIITARSAMIEPASSGGHIGLTFEDGQQIEELASGRTALGQFARLAVTIPFDAEIPHFRLRGAAERELTLAELLDRMRRGDTDEIRARAASEAYIRLVRSVSPPLLPLLAIPLGVASKRGKRGFGVALAAAILLLYEHAIEFAQSVADRTGWSPTLVVWTPFVLFAALVVWLFASGRNRPGQTPFTVLIDRMSLVAMAVQKRLTRKGSPS